MKVVLVGGGTMGPVSPLLAVADYLQNAHLPVEFLFVGTKNGPEQRVVENAKINFVAIFAGKLRRYWSLANFFAPFLFFAGLVHAFILLLKFKPTCVFGAGGFVQVPVIYAAWVLRIPVIIHQQDVDVTLSNSLCAPFATKITVSFEHSMRDFSQGLGFFKSPHTKIVWTGNPVRESLSTSHREEAVQFFHLDSTVPTVLITGGSSGAYKLNELIAQALPELLKVAQIIHTVGVNGTISQKFERYHPYTFIDRMDLALSVADAVVSRAGMSAISELSLTRKPSIVIPMPDTHQESNAALLWNQKAAVVLDQTTLTSQELVSEINKLLLDGQRREELSKNIHELMPEHATKNIAIIIKELHS